MACWCAKQNILDAKTGRPAFCDEGLHQAYGSLKASPDSILLHYLEAYSRFQHPFPCQDQARSMGRHKHDGSRYGNSDHQTPEFLEWEGSPPVEVRTASMPSTSLPERARGHFVDVYA